MDKLRWVGPAVSAVGSWLGKVAGWSAPWVRRNVTFGLVLAIATEAPRWAFAFHGANEPVWAGVAVAVLMAYAAAQGWDEYFRRRDTLLLSLNLGQIVSALVIITPVVFVMAKGEPDIHLADVVGVGFMWVWCGTLVLSTFLPLVLVAYVEVMRHGGGAGILPVDRTEAGIVTINLTDSVQSDPVSRPPVPSAKGEGAARMRELYDRGRGVTGARELADAAGVGYETAKSWLRRNRVEA